MEFNFVARSVSINLIFGEKESQRGIFSVILSLHQTHFFRIFSRSFIRSSDYVFQVGWFRRSIAFSRFSPFRQHTHQPFQRFTVLNVKYLSRIICKFIVCILWMRQNRLNQQWESMANDFQSSQVIDMVSAIELCSKQSRQFQRCCIEIRKRTDRSCSSEQTRRKRKWKSASKERLTRVNRHRLFGLLIIISNSFYERAKKMPHNTLALVRRSRTGCCYCCCYCCEQCLSVPFRSADANQEPSRVHN